MKKTGFEPSFDEVEENLVWVPIRPGYKPAMASQVKSERYSSTSTFLTTAGSSDSDGREVDVL